MFRHKKANSDKLLSEIQHKFSIFLEILDTNNRILKIIGDMEEKSQGEYLFDINYIITSVQKLRTDVQSLIDKLVLIGGEKYRPLKDRHAAIDAGIQGILHGKRYIQQDDFTVPLQRLTKERALSVGSKIAQLGEIRARLGLPVPGGFAITAWAYKHFVTVNNLQEKIDKSIHSLDIKNYGDLIAKSAQIQDMIRSSTVPEDLVRAITGSFSALQKSSSAPGFALRSSALGEDTLFSFAGQYATFLNVREDEIIDRYRDVLASKFTPKAIYYFLSHAMSEAELAMGVGCMEMIDAAASGVIYTLDPVHPDEDCMLINAINGLGAYLVDGTVTPDVVKVSRKDGSVRESGIAVKTVKLCMRQGGGVQQEQVPASLQRVPSIGETTVQDLRKAGLAIEKHYACPQDIEWALDPDRGLYILQTRPLRVMEVTPVRVPPDVPQSAVLVTGGSTVCPGAGAGTVYHADSPRDLSCIPQGSVLITRSPFPGIVMVINKVCALVTVQGGTASHMATIAREYRIPMLAGVNGALDIPPGTEVTVDATGTTIYSGRHDDLLKARHVAVAVAAQAPVLELIGKVLDNISPLNLLDVTAENFTPRHCTTYHDITRFVHQKAMEEMFTTCSTIGCSDDIGVRLKSSIPMAINIVYIDRNMGTYAGTSEVEEDRIDSAPMQAFWSGVRREGWPSTPRVNLGGLISVVSSQALYTQQNNFLVKSFAILGKEYMLLGLHMGYHFSTVEALCTEDPGKNYIRMQYKDGGAALERRIRRIKVLADILGILGFSTVVEADFLDSSIHYQSSAQVLAHLEILGRLSMMFKQLDMALANDAVAGWYKQDFLKRLELRQVSGKADA